MFHFKVNQTQNKLVEIQPNMKAELLSGVKSFQNAVQNFYADYDNW